jgi:uncharacterized OB-fold protein
MSERPAPVPDQDSTPFWEATADGRLLVQHCGNCDRNQLYPRLWCRYCHSDNLDWQEASGRGQIYSVTMVRRAPSPAFADAVPYVVALVELEEGPRVMANILDAAPGEAEIVAAVALDWIPVADDLALPAFRLVADAGAPVPTAADARPGVA